MRDVTVIIPTYNKAEYLDLTLAGFCIQIYKEFNIVIVDDGSSDKTRDVVDNYSDKLSINYIYQENAGRCAAKNVALNNLNTEYVIFSDDDRIPDKNFVNKHIEYLKENPNTVTIGSKYDVLSFWDDRTRLYKSQINYLYRKNSDNFGCLLNINKLISPEMLISSFDTTIEVFGLGERTDNCSDVRNKYTDNLIDFHFGWAIATTGNMALKLPKEKVLFDERLKGWGGEDNEYAYQLSKLDYKFGFVPKAVNYHQLHQRGNNEMDQLKSNIGYLISKYPTLEMKLFNEVFSMPRGFVSFVDINEKYRSVKNKEPVV
ncbi:glycosyltransferase family 2 protein [Paenibacillus sp. FSL H3-0333]|uniref:glycosyltransferase family 2 protein n=1 Tax=Paenibacillus sp. FSL H3-0333 TaxID=2921373 RepID=UPI0030FC94A3